MNHLRRADAKVAQATHPTSAARWRFNRYNPAMRWRMRKHKVMHPVQHQKMRARARLNYMNPFFYLRRIKNNLKRVMHGRRRRATVIRTV